MSRWPAWRWGCWPRMPFRARYENVTLTKWTLRIIVIGGAVFGYLVTAAKDQNAFLDMRYLYSFALAMASEIVLQFWRREPTGGARAPLDGDSVRPGISGRVQHV